MHSVTNVLALTNYVVMCAFVSVLLAHTSHFTHADTHPSLSDGSPCLGLSCSLIQYVRVVQRHTHYCLLNLSVSVCFTRLLILVLSLCSSCSLAHHVQDVQALLHTKEGFWMPITQPLLHSFLALCLLPASSPRPLCPKREMHMLENQVHLLKTG